METNNKEKKNFGIKTFTVPFSMGELKENITVYTDPLSQNYKESNSNQASQYHPQENHSELAKYYKSLINKGSHDYKVFSNYGMVLKNLGKLKEAEISLRKSIELNPDFVEAISNLGEILKDLGKFKEAEITLRKAINLNPYNSNDYKNLGNVLANKGQLKEAQIEIEKAIQINPNSEKAHLNLGVIFGFNKQNKEAESSFRKAIEIKPNYADAHYNLGILLKDLGRSEEAELSFQKALKIKPNWEASFLYSSILFNKKEFDKSLITLQKIKSLVSLGNLKTVEAAIKVINNYKNKLRSSQNSNLHYEEKFNRLISNRPVERELITYLYKLNTILLDNTKSSDSRYGKGLCSDFNLFEDNSPIIKKLEIDLIEISKRELNKKELIINDSFFNIFISGSGSRKHHHIGKQDCNFRLYSHKYSLVYYLDVGDQNSENPGVLNLYDPDEKILPSKGMIIILNSTKLHSVSYTGRKDRVMVGVNFYAF